MSKPIWVANAERIQEIHQEAGGNDAETLARLFTDDGIVGPDDLVGRINALLESTEQHWFQGVRSWMDLPGLQECKGFRDKGFRPEFQDPWPNSCDQTGHFLTAIGLSLNPQQLNRRKFCVRMRDWLGAPKDMDDEEVALRTIIGHEKYPDPYTPDLFVLPKVRFQFSAATAADTAAFRAALACVKPGLRLDLECMDKYLASIQVGTGRGNSLQDLRLSCAGYCFVQLVRSGRLVTRQEAGEWVKQNLEQGEGG